MAATSELLTILMLILSVSVYSSHLNYRLICSAGKYKSQKSPGYFYYQRGSVEEGIEPYNVTNTTTMKSCQNECLISDSCSMAQYQQGGPAGVCALFNMSDAKMKAVESNDTILLRFLKCDNNSVEVCGDSNRLESFYIGRTASSRCAGLWVQLVNSEFKPEYSESISTIPQENYSLEEALKKCLDSIECDAINYKIEKDTKKPSFEFIRTWNYPLKLIQHPDTQNKTTSSALYWECGNCTEGISSDWTVISYATRVQANRTYLSIFYTVSVSSCQQECDQINHLFIDVSGDSHNQLICDTVYYNDKTNLCLVEDRSNSTPCSQFPPMSNKDIDEPMTKFVKIIANTKGLSADNVCVCLSRDRESYSDVCGSPKYEFNYTLYSGTALKYAHKTVHSPDSKVYRRFYTGYEYIWVKYEYESDKDPACRTKQWCKLFNANMNIHNPKYKLVSRASWGAQPTDNGTHFKTSINCVELEAALWPPCGCYTKESCAHHLRSLQTFTLNVVGDVDLNFNFIIGDDGRIYEGRGWKNESNMEISYRESCVRIGLLGDFAYKLPTLKAIDAFKSFLRQAVSNKLILSDFIIRDWRISQKYQKRPFYYLDILLSIWPNYAGRLKKVDKVCYSPEKIVKICITGVIAVALIIVAVFFLYYRDHLHLPMCKTVRNILLYKQNLSTCQLIWSTSEVKEDIIPVINASQNEFTRDRLPSLNLICNFCISMDLKSPEGRCNCSLQLRMLCNYLNSTRKYMDLMESLLFAKLDGFLMHCFKQTYLIFLQSNEIGEQNQLIFIHSDNEIKVKTMVKQILDGKFCACRNVKVYLSDNDEDRDEGIEDVMEYNQKVEHEKEYFKKYEKIVNRQRIQSWEIVMAGH